VQETNQTVLLILYSFLKQNEEDLKISWRLLERQFLAWKF